MGLFSSIERELYSVAVDDRNTYSMKEIKVVTVTFFPQISLMKILFTQVDKSTLGKTFHFEVYGNKSSKQRMKVMKGNCSLLTIASICIFFVNVDLFQHCKTKIFNSEPLHLKVFEFVVPLW